jgi:integrase
LDKLLPRRSRVQPIVHMKALPYAEVPALMARLRDLDTVPARALAFTILTATRSGEVLGARWGEIDLETRVWSIPAERMKSKKTHRVPLSEVALDTLPLKFDRQDSSFVFPGELVPGLYHSAMWDVLRALGVNGITVHGFRSSFRDWAGNETNFSREICEAALAHAVGNATEAAYRRGDALAKRAELMQAWADFVAPKAA